MALRGRFEQPIVGLEATCVTIRIRSTLVGRALTHLPDVKELTRIYSLAEAWRVERQSPERHWDETSGDAEGPLPYGRG